MVTAQEHFGESREELLTGSGQTLHPGQAKLWVLNAVGAGFAATIIDARKLRKGTFRLVVSNVGTESFNLQDATASVLAALPSSTCAFCHLLDNSTEQGTWVVNLVPIGQAQNPGLGLEFFVLGGRDNNGTWGTAELAKTYNPQLQLWTAHPTSSGHTLERSGVGLIGAAAICVGGGTSSFTQGNWNKTTELVTNPITWTSKLTFPRVQFNDAGSTGLNGKLILAGNGAGALVAEREVWEFVNGSPGTWTQRANITGITDTKKEGNSFNSWDATTAFSFGGLEASSVRFCDEYDETTDTWNARSLMPDVGFSRCQATQMEGEFTLWCTSRGSSSGSQGILLTPEVRAYDPTTDTWRFKLDWPFLPGRYDYAAHAFDYTGWRVYIGGGQTYNDTSLKFYEVVTGPVRDTYTSIGVMPVGDELTNDINNMYQQGVVTTATP